jgi:hypothetical protein
MRRHVAAAARLAVGAHGFFFRFEAPDNFAVLSMRSSPPQGGRSRWKRQLLLSAGAPMKDRIERRTFLSDYVGTSMEAIRWGRRRQYLPRRVGSERFLGNNMKRNTVLIAAIVAVGLWFGVRDILWVYVATGLSLVEKPAPTSDELKLDEGIPLGEVKGRIDHLAIDLARKRLFVAELSNDSVAVVDLAAGALMKRLTGLKERKASPSRRRRIGCSSRTAATA